MERATGGSRDGTYDVENEDVVDKGDKRYFRRNFVACTGEICLPNQKWKDCELQNVSHMKVT